jgi:hypothetical protein
MKALTVWIPVDRDGRFAYLYSDRRCPVMYASRRMAGQYCKLFETRDRRAYTPVRASIVFQKHRSRK